MFQPYVACIRITVMKKYCYSLISLVLLLAPLEIFAQDHTTYYPDSSRYLYSVPVDSVGCYAGLGATDIRIGVISAQPFYVSGNQGTDIFGVGLMVGPLFESFHYPDCKIVYIIQKSTDSLSYYIVDSVEVDSAVRTTDHILDLTHLPDLNNGCLEDRQNRHKFHILEAFFDTPVHVTDSFYIGIRKKHHTLSNPTDIWFDLPEYDGYHFHGVYNRMKCFDYVRGNRLEEHTAPVYGQHMVSYWGGWFPIIESPESDCGGVVDHRVDLTTQTSAVLGLKAGMHTSLLRVSYCPEGSSDTLTVDSVALSATEEYTTLELYNLQPNTNYSVVAEGYCDLTRGLAGPAYLCDFATRPLQVPLTGLSADTTMGYVTGTNYYPQGSQAVFAAVPYAGYEFERWDDGSADNPRTVVVTVPDTLVAYFQPLRGIAAADEVRLTVAPNPARDRVLVSGCDIRRIELYDVGGRLILTTADTLVDVSALPSGLYLLRALTAEGTVAEKLVRRD